MNSLEQHSDQTYEMPRFDDGMINIQELIRIMTESIVNEIILEPHSRDASCIS